MVATGPRSDDRITVVAADYNGQICDFNLTSNIPFDNVARWSNYVRGVAWGLIQREHQLQGANLVIARNVPKGAGLSSSASLEVVIGTALAHLSHLDIDGKTIALNGQQAENDFVGIKCGIMDQFVSALGQEDYALLIDCRSLDYQTVPIPTETAIIIINSNVKRGLVDSEYNTRRQECEQAATHFGVPALRDVSLDMFLQQEAKLEETVAKRARHVITENDRTKAAVAALKQGDLQQMSHLMAESHRSMRDNFEITVPPVDTLVEIVGAVIGQEGGVRMTGGGFGGCVVALAPKPLIVEIETAVAQKYPVTSGLEATIYTCRASAGASLC